jgi:hypothetical protein
MLKLSSDQEAVFAAEARRAYQERVVDLLREGFDNARAMRRRDLRPVVREQIDKAKGHGLISMRQVATYVVTAWILGVDFDERFPVLRRTLHNWDIDPQRKAEILIEHTMALLSALSEE